MPISIILTQVRGIKGKGFKVLTLEAEKETLRNMDVILTRVGFIRTHLITVKRN